MFDILIKNGEVIDGTGKTPRTKFDIAIEKGQIVQIAKDIPAGKAGQVIDASNKIVAPGFIDIQNHSDSYWTVFDEPESLSLISQGITSIILGNCGSSLAPLTTGESIKTIQKWHDLSGINLNWATFSEMLIVLSDKVGVNVGSLVGHSTLRRGLLADAVRAATMDEIQIMSKLLAQSMEAGAFGLSLGLVYAHEVNSTRAELEALAQVVKEHGGYLSVHLRSEGDNIAEAIDEVIELAGKTSVPLKISHLKVRNKKNWHLQTQVINKLESAYHKGLDISFDVYPYDTSWSVLYTYLPKWAYEGGRAQILKLIDSPVERKKILEYLKTQEYNYRSIVVATSEHNVSFIGKSIAQIANNSGVASEEALLDVIKACAAQAVVFDNDLSMEQVENFLASPLAIIATDGAGYSRSAKQLVHPRCFGTIPKYLSWVRQSQSITWEEAIRKITSEPARLLGLKSRGEIGKNTVADLVVFDPQTIADKATYENPYQLSEGVDHVLIGGQIAFENKKVTGLFGSLLMKE